MKFTVRLLIPVLFVLTLVFSCKPEPVPEPVVPTTGTICLSFEHVAGADSLIIDPVLRYQNEVGDSFSCETFMYYISNISFTDNSGNTWYEPESYHLVNAANLNSCKFNVNGVPPATYTSMTFMIGVDSARNVSGAQTGALDPAHGMFWTWVSGYVMAKFEGKSPQSTAGFNLVIFHTGGFSGPDAAQRWASPSFGSSTSIATTSTVSTIHIKGDLLEWFASPNPIDFSIDNVSNAPGPINTQIANNYMDMFTVTGIDN